MTLNAFSVTQQPSEVDPRCLSTFSSGQQREKQENRLHKPLRMYQGCINKKVSWGCRGFHNGDARQVGRGQTINNAVSSTYHDDIAVFRLCERISVRPQMAPKRVAPDGPIQGSLSGPPSRVDQEGGPRQFALCNTASSTMMLLKQCLINAF